jgi:carboxynorspermidine decarboxylase
MPYRPLIKQGSRKQISDWHPYRLGGLSCLAGDFLDTYWFEKRVNVGDRITFLDMMHYTMVKTTMFNGIKHPAITIQRQIGSTENLKEFSYEDFKNRMA